MTLEEIQQYLKQNGVESKLSIKQPWILWRMKTSLISLSDVAKIIESDINESTDDD